MDLADFLVTHCPSTPKNRSKNQADCTARITTDVQSYSCAAGAMCAAHLCTVTHSRCAAVLTISPVLG